MNVIKCSVIAAFILSPFFVQADKYTTNVYIDSVEAFGNGNVWIFARDRSDTSGCYENGKQFKAYITATVTEQAVKNILSVALAAQASGRPVDIYHSETQNCMVSKLRVKNIR
jgi:hypothetical protein